MRRADRLFDIVQALRGGRPRTAADLAQALEVSIRTIYRDVAALQASGVPIEGEAGVGYLLRPGFLLPPLALSEEEAQALVLGARLVAAWADGDLARAAQEVLVKLDAADAARDLLGPAAPPLRSFGRPDPRVRGHLAVLRRALRARRKLDLLYRTPASAPLARRVRPLALDFWGPAWTLTAWCELRGDFRTFRLDRIEALSESAETFRPEPGRTLADHLCRLAAEGYVPEPATSRLTS
jgi:predicted DNA-binding transcriptional regulator YafY